MSILKKILKAPLKVITAPIKLVKLVDKGVTKVTNQLYLELGLMILRHGLTALGVSAAFSSSELTQLIGGVSTAVGLVWSAYRKIQRAKQPATPTN